MAFSASTSIVHVLSCDAFGQRGDGIVVPARAAGMVDVGAPRPLAPAASAHVR